MPSIGGSNSETRRTSDTSLNAISVAGNNPISSQITSVNSTGNRTTFPMHAEMNNQVSIAGDRNELHRANHIKQAQNIHQLLGKTFPQISERMILSALCAGASGNLIQQEINYRPENSLVLLSLLTQDEINREPGLLSSANELITSLNTPENKFSNLKSTLNNEERAFDKKMASVFKNIGESRWQIISDRFVEKYVEPAIKDKLAEVFDREAVDSCDVNDTLVSVLEHQSKLKTESYIQEYEQHGKTSFADKALQLHNVFLELESKIEHIRSFKGMNSASESASQGAASNTHGLVGDDVDAGLPRPALSPALAPNTVNTTNYRNVGNTYNINHYHNGASSDSTAKAQNSPEKSVLSASLPQGINAVVNTPKNNPLEWVQYKRPVSVSTMVSEDETDGVSGKNDRPELRTSAEQPRKHIADIQWLLPKNSGFESRYIKTESGWKSTNTSEHEAKPVVTTVGGLNRSQADKEIYQGLRTAPQTVPAEQMFADSIAKADELFTGTEHGALRANQAEVERYNDNAKRFP